MYSKRASLHQSSIKNIPGRIRGPKAGPFHAVLFDLDGTLLDTTQAIYESLRHTIRHFTGRRPRTRLAPYMGRPLTEQMSLLLPA